MPEEEGKAEKFRLKREPEGAEREKEKGRKERGQQQ